jgi:hypothetical protein
MSTAPTAFSCTGNIQTYVVPATGSYVIEAAGGQGGGDGGKGARVRGTFYLNAGDVLQVVVGQCGQPGSTPHQPAGGGGGGSFVWRGVRSLPLPAEPLLVAGGGGGGDNGGPGLAESDGGDGAAPGGRNGLGGHSDPQDFHYSGGGGAGWRAVGALGSSPTLCGGGLQWRGGKGANYCCNRGGDGGFGGGGGGAFLGNGSGGGGGYSGGGAGSQRGPHAGGGGSYNAGALPANTPGANLGDGCVSILAIPIRAPLLFSDRPVGAASLDARVNGLEGKGYF